MITVKKISFVEFYSLPEFENIIWEYTSESALEDMPPINPNIDLYIKLNEAGVLTTLVAFDDDSLIGFANFIMSPNLHYSTTTAVTESFFVKEDYRKTGAGMFLLKEMERLAKEKGAIAFLVSAPTDSKLSAVMDKNKAYKETNKVFFRSLA
jgi:GNAT superfamily N-acetyltransferase